MIRETGFEKTKMPNDDKKNKSLLRKAYDKVDDFGKLRAAKWLAATALATAVAVPPMYGMGKAMNESAHPSLADEETWHIFLSSTFNAYGNVIDTALWPVKQGGNLIYHVLKDDGLTGEPEHILVCKPLNSLQDGHYQYYKQMDRKLQEILANQQNNEQIQDMLDNGYTPIIKYTTPFMKNAGDIMLSHAPIDHRTSKNPTCGSNIYRADTVKIVR